MTPPRPALITPEGLPPNTVSMLVPFWRDRSIITPRLLLVHTNGANGIATNQSSYNWATNKPGTNTLPHYQVQRDGRAAKYIPSNRKGLDNATVTASSADWPKLTQAQRSEILAHGQVRDWSLGIETSDDGYGTGRLGDLSGFTDPQVETLAGIIAYESILWGFPLEYPATWWGTGAACHTEPFEYPFWTLFRGKTCPGSLKKQQMRQLVLPRARQILADWSPPHPIEPPTNLPSTADTGDEAMLGIYKGPTGDALFELFPNGDKIWIVPPPDGMWAGAEALCRLNGKSAEVQVIDNISVWSALGVIKGPVPPGYDVYGNLVG